MIDFGLCKTLWQDWLKESALPLWSQCGFDRSRTLYHERLTFEGTPVLLPELRLMVQARQVATYCRAALDGVHDAAEQAIDCLEEIGRRYHGSDGEKGWIFSLAPDGRPGNRTRDLYAHAFILFGYAWAYRLTGNGTYLATARQTVLEIDLIFKAENGGYRDAVPTPDMIRRQNPHMHLLEAYLALFEVSSDSFYLDYARQIVALALKHFIDPGSGMLLEYFDSKWIPLQPAGQNRVEPGHLFEWSWLFTEYCTLASGESHEDALLRVADGLFQTGSRHGTAPDTADVYDAITESGTQLELSTRIWPQTEFMRLLCQRLKNGLPCDRTLLSMQATRFFTLYAPARLHGGWIDRLMPDGRKLVDYMPASSLYHIYGAAREIARVSVTQEQTAVSAQPN